MASALVTMTPAEEAKWEARWRELGLLRALDFAEEARVRWALLAADGNQSAAAELLGITRVALAKRLAREFANLAPLAKGGHQAWRAADAPAVVPSVAAPFPPRRTLIRSAVSGALSAAGGSLAGAARILQTPESTLRTRLLPAAGLRDVALQSRTQRSREIDGEPLPALADTSDHGTPTSTGRVGIRGTTPRVGRSRRPGAAGGPQGGRRLPP